MTPLDPPASRARLAGFLAHLVWELVLLVMVIALAVIVFATTGFPPGLSFWFQLATLGLLATAFALSLRTATPNLAVTGIAMLAGVVLAKLLSADWPVVPAALLVIAGSLIVGLFLGVVTGLTSVPAWAVSLGGLAAVQAVALAVAQARGIAISTEHRMSTWGAVLWTAAFVLASLAGGALFTVPAVRKALGTNRTDGDPARFRASRLLGAVVGLGGSSLIAGAAGVALALYIGGSFPTNDIFRLVLVVGVVLLGGVSAFGRRGGVAGTVLAVALAVLISTWLAREGAPSWLTFGVVPAAFVLFGVLVTRVLEWLAGPHSATATASISSSHSSA